MTEQGFTDLGLQATNGDGCGCCASPQQSDSEKSAAVEDTVSAQFGVEGMTCAHCVSSVTEEVSAIDGVSGVEIDLRVGGVSTVTVSSATPVDADRVREAVEEAGYRLAATP